MRRQGTLFSKKYFRSLLLVIIVLAATFGAAAAAHYNQVNSPLFQDAGLSGPQGLLQELAVVRQRYVTIDPYPLEWANPGSQVELNLFEDVILYAVVDSVSKQGDATVWMGHVPDIPLSMVALTGRQGQFAGDIVMPEAIYQVRYAMGDGTGRDVHVIYQIDQSQYPEEAPPIEVNLPGKSQQAAAAPGSPTDDGSVIDVLVGYTPAARDTAGGLVGIQNLINLAVAEANQSYANSGITQRLNLVYMGEVAYTETGDIEKDLVRLQSSGDGFLESLRALRNTYYADTVTLIEETSDYCGISYLMTDVSADFEDWAYAVVARSCATGYFSFAHELGHNMGTRHDWYMDTGITPYTYSHAYLNVANRWRTIMAYNNECAAHKVNCTRIPYWSNPALYYNGAVMGIPGGTDISCVRGDKFHPACDADNHRALNNTAYTVANFRQRPIVKTATPTATSTRTLTPTPSRTPTQTGTPTPTPVDVVKFPFYDGFEGGGIGAAWVAQATNQGRVQVSHFAPYAGWYSALLDDQTEDEIYSLAELILPIDLSGQSNVDMHFHWRSWADEVHPEDGVFISDDEGLTWAKVFSFDGSVAAYQLAQVDIDGAAAANGLSLNSHFQIKFQFYDNDPIPNDGYGIDEVWIFDPDKPTETPTPTVTKTPTMTPTPTLTPHPFWNSPLIQFLPLIRK
jgi:hypothetical protein